MGFFFRIYNYFFYNPYKVIKKNKNITVGKTAVLLKSCLFSCPSKSQSYSVVIGDQSMVGCHFIFESEKGYISIGDNCFVNSGTKLISRSSIIIGNHVTISWGCTLYDHNSHSMDYVERRNDIITQLKDYHSRNNFIKSKNWESVKSRPIVIEDDVWIGFDVVVLSGVKIGKGAIIGARSVVREDVEPWTVVIGNPAKVVKRLR